MRFRIAFAALAIALSANVIAAPLVVPFDFSRSAIGLNVTVKGVPLYMILDTGVDPSVIDIHLADKLRLKVDRAGGGEAAGGGNAAHALVFPTRIEKLAFGGRSFASVEALAAGMATLSAHYGRKLDGVLGYSFLTDKIVLIDYPRHTLALLDRPEEAASMVGQCRQQWSAPLRSFKDDSIPVIAEFRFGTATAPISLDTGSNGGIALYQAALDLPGMRGALVEKDEITYSGARGNAKAKAYALNEPVGFGPLVLPSGQAVTLRDDKGSSDTRVANIGNKLFAQMQLKMLLDYRARRMTFYGDCH